MSIIDPLTKLYNRRFFYTEVTSGLARAKRYSQPFSLLLMDLDHFKKVNDTHGHECGDKVLIAVAEILSRFTREGDTLARYGGEEFIMALPETDTAGAIKLAERIEQRLPLCWQRLPWEWSVGLDIVTHLAEFSLWNFSVEVGRIACHPGIK